MMQSGTIGENIGQFRPRGGFPTQSELVTSRSVSKFDYAIRPPTNICRSRLPEWQGTLAWVLASPGIGYGCTFAEYLLQIEPGGGSAQPEPEAGVEGFLYVLGGTLQLSASQAGPQRLDAGGYAFLPPDVPWSAHNAGGEPLLCLWVRKAYQPFKELKPAFIVGKEQDLPAHLVTGEVGWATKYLLPPDDLAYDMAMSIMEFPSGGVHSYIETHAEEHGLYMLQGQGVYYLGAEWHEVIEGDFIWMRSYCPQSYYAGGKVGTRYLIYKNANRQILLKP